VSKVRWGCFPPCLLGGTARMSRPRVPPTQIDCMHVAGGTDPSPAPRPSPCMPGTSREVTSWRRERGCMCYPHMISVRKVACPTWVPPGGHGYTKPPPPEDVLIFPPLHTQ
jgi:hypothetical protein